MKQFADRCREEMTRNVIFLLQRCRRVYHTLPDSIELVEGAFVGGHGTQLREQDVLQLCVPGENYHEWWDTESVWLDRETAEHHAKAQAYNYPVGWRVYGVPAEGQLATLLGGT